MGKKTRKNYPFSLGFRHPAGGGPSDVHMLRVQKFGKDRAYGSLHILRTDRQTHTNACSSQYFVTNPHDVCVRVRGADVEVER